MLDNLFGPIENYERAMSRTSQRHSLLTGNIANVNTPGYKRKDIDFNITLQDELNKSGSRLRSMKEGQVQTDNSSIRLDGSNVDMEKEVMSLAETELRFQALTDMTAGYFSGLKNVIREGR